MALSHVVPDLILKTLNYNGKLEILGKGNQIRHYTYGEDLAKGIVLLLDHEKAKNNDFNLSTSKSTTVLELADLIFKKFILMRYQIMNLLMLLSTTYKKEFLLRKKQKAY